MKLTVQMPVDASKEAIWKVISNIKNAEKTITGIEKVEVLEEPKEGLVGLKWRETRTLFGKTATEVMWITEAKENSHYKTRAESHGSIYITEVGIVEENGKNHIRMEFNGQPQSFGAKIMGAMLGSMMKNATKKALMKDLEDIKKASEK
jgi:hypothetical protein